METLFNFTLTRPAVEQSESTPNIELAQASPFQKALAVAATQATPRTAVKAEAARYVASADFLSDVIALNVGAALLAFGDTCDRMQAQGASHASLAAAVQQHFGGTASNLAASEKFTTAQRRLRDSVIAIKTLPGEHRRPLHKLANALRDLELIGHLALDATFPKNAARLREYRHRSLRLPDFLQSALREPIKGRPAPNPGDGGKRFHDALRDFRNLEAAIIELSRVDGAALAQSPSKASGASLPPAHLRPGALFELGIKQGKTPLQLSSLGQLAGIAVRAELLDHAAFGRSAVAAQPGAAASGLADAAGQTQTLTTRGQAQRVTPNGRAAFAPPELVTPSFRMSARGLESLSENARIVLKQFALNLATQSLDGVVDLLRGHARASFAELQNMSPTGTQRSVKRVNGALFLVASPVLPDWLTLAPGVFVAPPVVPAAPLMNSVPTTHGTVAPAGVMDLLVVKQQLIGYEAMDIAHIENVLRGEGKLRVHRQLRQTEELTFRESETTTSEERDLESTDRFEMSRETSETIKEEASLKAGLSVSGKYGPAVEFSVSAEGSISRSKEESTKAASTFSKEVTQKSASKITRRVLERASRRVTTEVEDRNEHTLNNVGGGDHIRGIYQWVEKIYQAQMFNYGLRTLFDFMLPEPGAFLIEVFRRANENATELKKPLDFTLRPDQISENNYSTWVLAYSATDVEPPPEPYLTKAHDFSAGNGDDKTDYNHSAQLSIDEGYRAIHASLGSVVNVWEDDWSVDVVIGNRAHRFPGNGEWVWDTSLSDERGAVAFALNTFKVSDIAFALEVKCQRTDRALVKWQYQTHAKLITAYKARVSEYEEKLAALKAEAGIAITGQSPAANLEVMKDELKKMCVTVLTAQHFDLFDAIDTGINGLPQLSLTETAAEGPYVRFFEQAFEWEHMTWVTYPYFWGRKSEWTDRLAIEDTDPMFNQFLKAGYCRVVAPVRPGFEGAVDHFMTFAEPWMGGPLPTVASDLYLPIADEIAERLDRPGDEFPQGDPWIVRLPTDLVRLRDDGSLPFWEQDVNGNWVAH